MVAGQLYYFEIQLLKGNLMKVGVCRQDAPFEQNSFCDTDQGWAVYNGELRHGSNHTSKKYVCQTSSTKFQEGDTVGVMVDMINGTLAFTNNQVYLGVAFKS